MHHFLINLFKLKQPICNNNNKLIKNLCYTECHKQNYKPNKYPNNTVLHSYDNNCYGYVNIYDLLSDIKNLIEKTETNY